MKTAILASLIAGAAAFAPAQKAATSTALNYDITKEIGVQAPLGYFAPEGALGDPTNVDQAEFERRRWIELKHGRVAMLAVVGYLVTAAGVRFPGAEDIPCGFAALPALPGMVWAQMIATWGLMEAANSNRPGKINGFTPEFQGDFRNGALDFGWDKQTDAWKRNKRTIELNQGRAAQMGIAGLMIHDLIIGNVDTLLPTTMASFAEAF